jgi:hypothetical protein
MAHKIHKPYDKVFSIISREWHNLAELVKEINREVLKPILFPIVEGKITISLEGEEVTLEDQKALVADYRHRDDIPEGKRIQPLSVMGKDYAVIDNAKSLAVVEEAIAQGLDAKIVTAGTVRAGKSFFLSLQQDDSSVEILKGDKWDFTLSIATSHDGTDSWNFYASSFRTVCWNTLRASLDAADTRARIFHTKNANLQLESMPEIIMAFRNQQQEIIEALTYLAGIKCDIVKAERIVSGYFSQLQGGELKFSARTSNAVRDIATLFVRGKGNNGKSMYDLLNGVTEYYTHGNGTGKVATPEVRAFRSEFGTAAEHKERFMGIISDAEKREEMEAIGAAVTLK